MIIYDMNFSDIRYFIVPVVSNDSSPDSYPTMFDVVYTYLSGTLYYCYWYRYCVIVYVFIVYCIV